MSGPKGKKNADPRTNDAVKYAAARGRPATTFIKLSDSVLSCTRCRGYPLSRYTCRATRVAADFLDFRAFAGVAAVSRHTP